MILRGGQGSRKVIIVSIARAGCGNWLGCAASGLNCASELSPASNESTLAAAGEQLCRKRLRNNFRDF
jgi:hypothetical protein